MSTKTSQITVRLSDDLGEALEAAAEAAGRTRGDVVREAIERQIKAPCKRCKGSGYEP